MAAPNPIDVAIGAKIRDLRLARRLSLEETGKAVGVTYQQIQKYETGANRTSSAMLLHLAKLFGVPVFELFPHEEQTAPAVVNPTIEAIRHGLYRLPGDSAILPNILGLVDALEPRR